MLLLLFNHHSLIRHDNVVYDLDHFLRGVTTQLSQRSSKLMFRYKAFYLYTYKISFKDNICVVRLRSHDIFIKFI